MRVGAGSVAVVAIAALFITPSGAAATGIAGNAGAGLDRSKECISCHAVESPGIIDHLFASRHAEAEISCFDCHQATEGEPDAFEHNGYVIATMVTPRDCARCHAQEAAQFAHSRHARAGDTQASLDSFLAEKVAGSRLPFEPHLPTPGREDLGGKVNGLASAQSSCQQCHGAKVAIRATDGGILTVDDFQPGPDGLPTAAMAVSRIARDEAGRPLFTTESWPNTGIGRLNLDGSLGSCSACHSRHDFSPRRARQPENCGKCHLGPDHPQQEIYEASMHGVAYRDLKDQMALDGKTWVLGKDYSAAPTCATCHLSATANGLAVTHDPAERISWTNRPPISLAMDTDADGMVVTETDLAQRAASVVDASDAKRARMQQVCTNCHAPGYVDAFYRQYDDLVVLYNEKFARPGAAIMDELAKQGLLTPTPFDERIEWDWYSLWHREGRSARHGASMMGPSFTHGQGMQEVASRFYQSLIPAARELARAAAVQGKKDQAAAVDALIDKIMSRPEHAWQQPEPDAKRTDLETANSRD